MVTPFESVITGTLIGSDPRRLRLTYEVSNAFGGTVIVDQFTGEYIFTPNIGFSDEAGFAFSVTNTVNQTSEIAQVEIRVNSPPVAISVPKLRTLYGSEVSGILEGVDSDGDSLTYVVRDVSGGDVSLDNNTGAFIFNPSSDFLAGTASFRFIVQDGIDTSPEVLVEIDVEFVEDVTVLLVRTGGSYEPEIGLRGFVIEQVPDSTQPGGIRTSSIEVFSSCDSRSPLPDVNTPRFQVIVDESTDFRPARLTIDVNHEVTLSEIRNGQLPGFSGSNGFFFTPRLGGNIELSQTSLIFNPLELSLSISLSGTVNDIRDPTASFGEVSLFTDFTINENYTFDPQSLAFVGTGEAEYQASWLINDQQQLCLSEYDASITITETN